MPFYKGAEKLWPNLSLQRLAPICRELHMAWGIWRQHQKYTDEKGHSWSKEDFWNMWRILDQLLRKKGGKGCVKLPYMPTSLAIDKPELASIYKGINIKWKDMSLRELAGYCQVLHMGWGTYRQYKNFTDVKGNEWTPKDFEYYRGILDNLMKEKGGNGCKPFNPFSAPPTKRDNMLSGGKCKGILFKNNRLATTEDYDEVCFCDGTCLPMKSTSFEKLQLELDARGANRVLAKDSTPEMRKRFLSMGAEVRYVDEELEQMQSLDDKQSPINVFLVGAERREIANFADGVMLNAVQTKKAEQLQPWRDSYKGKIMLDNGIFGDVLLSIDELVGRVNTIVPDVAVGPDVLYDRDIHIKSVKRQKEFMGKKIPDVTEVMLVPQGNTCLEFESCVKEIIKMKPNIIGLGRMSMKVAGYPGRGHKQRIYALHRLQQLGLMDEIKSEGIKMHALGLSKPWELPYLNKFGFWGIDSMSYIYSSLYHQLAMPGDPTEMSFHVINGGLKQTRGVEDEVHEARLRFIKSYPHDGSLEARQNWIIKNVWNPMKNMKATDYHVLSTIKDLKFEDRDDTPMLEKPKKEGLRERVYGSLQDDGQKIDISDLRNVNIGDLDTEELRNYHFLTHVAWKRSGCSSS